MQNPSTHRRRAHLRPLFFALATLAAPLTGSLACDMEVVEAGTWPVSGSFTFESQADHGVAAATFLDRMVVKSSDVNAGTSTLTCLASDGTVLGQSTLSGGWSWGPVDRNAGIMPEGFSRYWGYASYSNGTGLTGWAFLIELDSACNSLDIIAVDDPFADYPGYPRGLAIDGSGDPHLGLAKPTGGPTDPQLDELWKYDRDTDTWSKAPVDPSFAGPILTGQLGPLDNDVNYDTGVNEIVAGWSGMMRRYNPVTLAHKGDRQLDNPSSTYTAAWDVYAGYTVQARRVSTIIPGTGPVDVFVVNHPDGSVEHVDDDSYEVKGFDLDRRYTDAEPDFMPLVVYQRPPGALAHYQPKELHIEVTPN